MEELLVISKMLGLHERYDQRCIGGMVEVAQAKDR
jgi:hypothetical protein